MTLEGTVVNGVIVLDGAPELPEGARVFVEVASAELDSAAPTAGFEYPHPLAPYDREKEIALLRESLAAMDAGERGKPVADVFAEINRELNQPAKGG